MVLQKTKDVPVWGWAAPGEAVTITLDKATAQTTTGPDGKWKLALDLSAEGQGPFSFTAEGKNKLVVNDVLIGDVWLCSGQSNCTMELQYCVGGKEEAAQSANPLFRMFNAKHVGGVVPLDDTPGSWIVASPEKSGSFSAIGYYFGKSVQNEIKIPVGIIHTALWGTGSQSWTSPEALDQDPVAKKEKDEIVGEWGSLPKRFADYQAAFPAWASKYGRTDHPPASPDAYAGPDISTADWKTVKMPGKLKASGMPDAGVVWLRHKVTITPDQANKIFAQSLGEIYYGTVYWNGVKVDDVSPSAPLRRAPSWEQPWTFRIPADQVKAGDNMLAIRLYSPAGGAGLNFEERKFPDFVGDWLAKTEYELPPLAPDALASYPGLPPFRTMDETGVPTYCFNGQLVPLIPYAIKGAIWYQGEANSSRPAQYLTLLPLMINDWRKHWGYDFPFYLVQLPNTSLKTSEPGESRWAETREVQMKTTLSVPNTGLAVTIDTADANLHPSNKKDPGERLALVALAKTYGLKKIDSGPIFDSMKIEGDKVRVHFTHTDGGLVTRLLPSTYILKYTSLSPVVPVTAPLVLPVPDSPVQGFAICGEDQQWKWASAKIDGDSVIVSASGVDKPVALRYAWADNPTCNLYNGAGLPAAPFRTDNFDTNKKK
jgi:sialate O-acetylesterase